MGVIEKFEAVEDKHIKESFIKLMTDYLSPAFGSMSKRDFDILLFMKLQELGAIDHNPQMYELVSELRVTRSKARNLLYEAKLRLSTSEGLDKELKALLQKPVLMKDGNKIVIEIDNPLLIDHLRHELKELHHAAVGSGLSFSLILC